MWHVTTYSLQGTLRMEAVGSSETFNKILPTTWRHIPEIMFTLNVCSSNWAENTSFTPIQLDCVGDRKRKVSEQNGINRALLWSLKFSNDSVSLFIPPSWHSVGSSLCTFISKKVSKIIYISFVVSVYPRVTVPRLSDQFRLSRVRWISTKFCEDILVLVRVKSRFTQRQEIAIYTLNSFGQISTKLYRHEVFYMPPPPPNWKRNFWYAVCLSVCIYVHLPSTWTFAWTRYSES
jgi:hypothetical protein